MHIQLLEQGRLRVRGWLVGWAGKPVLRNATVRNREDTAKSRGQPRWLGFMIRPFVQPLPADFVVGQQRSPAAASPRGSDCCKDCGPAICTAHIDG